MCIRDRLGIDTKIKVIHPLTGEKLPLWIGNFVLLDYGTGVVMGVPGHDSRDYEFATKYELSIKQVIKTKDDDLPITENGILINSDKYDGMTSEEASNEIIKELVKLNSGAHLIQFRLRDWGVSRQRYWGCPIPVVYENGVPKVIEEKDMPIKLPELDKNSPPIPLSQNKEFINIKDGVIRESSMGDDHPIVWTNCVGKGKAFYSAMGHKGKYFLEPLHLELIKSGILWAADKSAKCN